MNVKPQIVKLDIKYKNLKKSNITFVQGDVGFNLIDIYLLDNGYPLDITNITNLTLTSKKLDNNVVVESDIEIIDSAKGYIRVNLDTNIISYPGDVITTIELFEGTNRLTSQQFSFSVIKQLDDGKAVISSSEYPAYSKFLNAATNEEQRILNENERIQNEVNRENTFSVNETNRSNTFGTNESQRNNTFEQNETTRQQSLNSKLLSADNKITEMNDKITEADSKISDVDSKLLELNNALWSEQHLIKKDNDVMNLTHSVSSTDTILIIDDKYNVYWSKGVHWNVFTSNSIKFTSLMPEDLNFMVIKIV